MMKRAHTNSNIELRSEEVQELMGKIPPVILRTGIFFLLVFVILIYVVSSFVKYPDTITLPIIAKNVNYMREIRIVKSGRIIDCGIDYGYVRKGDTLAKIAVNEPASQDSITIVSPISGVVYPCDTYHAADYVEKNAILCVIVDSIMGRVVAKSYLRANLRKKVKPGLSVVSEMGGVVLQGNVQSVADYMTPTNNVYALTITFELPKELKKTVLWNIRANAKIRIKEQSVSDRIFKGKLFHHSNIHE